MRELHVSEITKTIRQLAIDSCLDLPKDIFQCLKDAYDNEPFDSAKSTLDVIIENAKVAHEERMPICQDTGMAIVFLKIGQDVHFIGGSLYEAIHEGVRQGYEDGYLRKSIVEDPLYHRINTKDNTPATIHVEIVDGDGVEILFAPKGFGSENMSQIKMLKPSDGEDGVKQFVLSVIEQAGANACPPMVVGVGIGGDFETVALAAKKAMLKEVEECHPEAKYASLEKELLDKANQLGIGPAGFGGKTSVLTLHINTLPTHIAGMPCAVAICCHVARHKKVTL